MNPDIFSRTIHTIAKALDNAGVSILLIGGFAVNHYGYTRATLDVDFMLAVDDLESVKKALPEAGFTNFSFLENVAFFQQPDNPVRVDFIQTDRATMTAILERANQTHLYGTSVRVPALNDLLAMKLFAAASGTRERTEKDVQDITHLCVLNNVEITTDLRRLCEKYANDTIYTELCQIIHNLKRN